MPTPNIKQKLSIQKLIFKTFLQKYNYNNTILKKKRVIFFLNCYAIIFSIDQQRKKNSELRIVFS